MSSFGRSRSIPGLVYSLRVAIGHVTDTAGLLLAGGYGGRQAPETFSFLWCGLPALLANHTTKKGFLEGKALQTSLRAVCQQNGHPACSDGARPMRCSAASLALALRLRASAPHDAGRE